MARYQVTSLDCSAEGMERLRSQSEFIALAYAGADATPEDILRELREDLDSCDRGDSFDFDAAREAIQDWSKNGGLSLISWELRALAGFNFEEDSPAFRLYVRDNWHGLPAPFPQAYVVTFESGAIALATIEAPDRDLGEELARSRTLSEAGTGATIWSAAAYPLPERFELGLVWLRAAPPCWRLVGFTARACYWVSRSGLYVATLEGEPPKSTSGGYVRLRSLMELKGESPSIVTAYCDESGRSRKTWAALLKSPAQREKLEELARKTMANKRESS